LKITRPIILSIAAVALLLVVAGYILATNWILIYPDARFPYRLDYKEFTIRSDEPIEKQIEQHLDGVSWRLASVLKYQDGSYKIYFCNRPKTYEIFSQKVGKPQKTQGFNLQPLNHIFINVPFVKEIKSKNQSRHKYSILEGNLAHVIAHEICHQLIADEIGYFTMRKVEMWKLEGFCEYAASKKIKQNNPAYRFDQLVGDFHDGVFDEIAAGRKFYIESEILVEYYLDYKNKTFTNLIRTDVDKEELLKELWASI